MRVRAPSAAVRAGGPGMTGRKIRFRVLAPALLLACAGLAAGDLPEAHAAGQESAGVTAAEADGAAIPEGSGIEMGLYRSGPMKVALPQGAEEGPYRLFLRLFADGRASLVLSPGEAAEVYRQFAENPDMAGRIRYTDSPDGISFSSGPTVHKVTTAGDGRVQLESRYEDGRTQRGELELVVPEASGP